MKTVKVMAAAIRTFSGLQKMQMPPKMQLEPTVKISKDMQLRGYLRATWLKQKRVRHKVKVTARQVQQSHFVFNINVQMPAQKEHLKIRILTRYDHGQEYECKCQGQLSSQYSIYFDDKLLLISFPLKARYTVEPQLIFADTFLNLVLLNLLQHFWRHTLRIHSINSSLVNFLSE